MTETQSNIPKADILIVDDIPANLRLLAGILAGRGYNIRSASHGRMALSAVQAQPPDLILLDIMMPEMDGYEVCRHLKADEQTRDIPVIFVSALDETIDKVMAFSIGGVDYITKPFQLEEVLARVETHLTIRNLQKQLQLANRELANQNAELEERNAALQEALSTIRTLRGIVPICAWCSKKIQSKEGEWVRLEAYIEEHSEASFTHGMCPDCREKFLDEMPDSQSEKSGPLSIST
jgi:CheY-like chemotaxis protein